MRFFESVSGDDTHLQIVNTGFLDASFSKIKLKFSKDSVKKKQVVNGTVLMQAARGINTSTICSNDAKKLSSHTRQSKDQGLTRM